jgi:hypothetical protein
MSPKIIIARTLLTELEHLPTRSPSFKAIKGRILISMLTFNASYAFHTTPYRTIMVSMATHKKEGFVCGGDTIIIILPAGMMLGRPQMTKVGVEMIVSLRNDPLSYSSV